MKRRDVLAGVVAAGAAVAAGLYRFTDLFVKHYAPTPYDDVLVNLVDREQAAKLGSVIWQQVHSDIFQPNENLAKEARKRLNGQDLRRATTQDVTRGDVVEIEGWVVPITVALLSALAARA